MLSSFKTWFGGEWSKFINWFGAAEAAVVAEGKTIIDELVPVIKADLLADGSAVLAGAETTLATGSGVAGIIALGESLIPTLAAQGITISKEAASVLAAFISAKISAAQAATGTEAATTPAVTEAPAA